MSVDRPAVGIRRMRAGWQAYIKLKGVLVTKQFPIETSVREMRRWRDDQWARARLDLPSPDGAFAADCRRYLALVAGMPTIVDRTHRIGLWKSLFGTRDRATLTPLEIQAALETWRKRGVSPGTLNLRRSALAHLFTTLDRGVAGAVNPVRAVPRYREVAPPLYLPTLAQAEAAVAAARHAHAKRDASKDWARLNVLLWTGWPAKLLMQLEPKDVDWTAGLVTLRPRAKGKGTRVRTLPVLPQGLAALKAFKQADAWGPFDNHNVRRALRTGCRKAGVPFFTTYALRHGFATLVATLTKDDRAVAELMMHTTTQQTRRYTEQSALPRAIAAVSLVARKLKARNRP